MKKLTKEDKILVSIIIGITAILGNAFLKTHFSSDTYVLFDLGYMEYPSKFFLLDGRLISTLACYIAGIYKIPYEAYLIVMDVIGVVILSVTIFIVYKKIVAIIRSNSKITPTINSTCNLCINIQPIHARIFIISRVSSDVPCGFIDGSCCNRNSRK